MMMTPVGSAVDHRCESVSLTGPRNQDPAKSPRLMRVFSWVAQSGLLAPVHAASAAQPHAGAPREQATVTTPSLRAHAELALCRVTGRAGGAKPNPRAPGKDSRHCHAPGGRIGAGGRLSLSGAAAPDYAAGAALGDPEDIKHSCSAQGQGTGVVWRRGGGGAPCEDGCLPERWRAPCVQPGRAAATVARARR